MFKVMNRILIILALLLTPMTGRAQAPDRAAAAVNVFLDCGSCDHDFVRTEVKYVNWVRDRTVADVHVLVSNEGTGGGGSRYTLTFTGLRDFKGREDTLTYNASTDETSDQRRRGLTRTVVVGLVPFISRTPMGVQRLRVSWEGESGATGATSKQRDPWNFWVFTLGLNSYFNGEESQNFLNWNSEIEANRVTEQFKLELELNGSFDHSSFTLHESTGDREVTAEQKYYSAEVLAVKSLGQHWSAGATTEAQQASFANIDFGLQGGPAIEYSFWPYSEATRRSLVVRYTAGVRLNDYTDLTIYNRMSETHPAHSLKSEMRLKQRWGSLNVQAEYSQYLHDTSFNNLYTYASADVRLFRGFSVNFYGSYSRVRDQLALSQEELTPEEVLLRQQELSTGFRYYGGVGVSYSFGSIFNNVVNPRF
jgi:hypothetical protein